MNDLAARAAALRPARSLTTLLVHSSNRGAIDLYLRHGFKNTGETDSDPGGAQEYFLFSKPIRLEADPTSLA